MTATAAPTRTLSLAAVLVLVLALLRLLVPPPGGPAPPSPTARPAPSGRAPATTAALEAARTFLDDYVTAEGRVRRTDQGDDTVSEGQAWGLLAAFALRDEARAAAIVAWTETHLVRDDGLLAWQWADGAVVGPSPASDADLTYAWGLARAGEAFDRPDWVRRAEKVVEALGRTSMVETDDGPLLTAGPWATRWQGTSAVNPSYLWPTALRWAEEQTPGLDGTTTATAALFERLTQDDTPLVPDWVTVDDDGTVEAIGSPADPTDPPQHGLDAVRTWIWLGTDCDEDLRASAARAHERFPASATDLKAVHDLAGAPVVEWRHAATLAGAAVAADAAGDTPRARARLDAATALDAEHPSYYGAAVTMLARLLLDTDRLVDCA